MFKKVRAWNKRTMQSGNDWLFKMTNRNAPKPHEAYTSVAMCWFLIGALSTILLLFLAGVPRVGLSARAWVVVVILIAILLACVINLSWITIDTHKKQGIYLAIAKASKENWEREAMRIGMTTGKTIDESRNE